MIAISYRREDSLPVAGRLYDRLQAKFGKQNVFMDFDSIRPGLDFREQIKQTIERSDVVIAIIGPRWLGEQRDKPRRIDDPTDLVRLEIAYALNARIPVIPVLVDNTSMPEPDELPREIEGLRFRHALLLDSGLDFHHHADRLIDGIKQLTSGLPSPVSDNKHFRISEQTRTPLEKERLQEPGGARLRSKQRRIGIGVVAAGLVLAIVGITVALFFGSKRRDGAVEAGKAPQVEESTPRPDELESRRAEEARIAALPKTIIVPVDETTISAAMMRAKKGDTIEVRAGTYEEQVSFKDGVILSGHSRETVAVRCKANKAALLIRDCSSGSISGITFEHNGSATDPSFSWLMYVANSYVEVFDCRMRKSGGFGIVVEKGGSPVIHDCIIDQNFWSGIVVNDSGTNPVLRSNRCSKNGYCGIYFARASGGVAEKNECEGSLKGIEVSGPGTSATLTGNHCFANHESKPAVDGFGIVFTETSTGSASGNVCEDNDGVGIAILGIGTSSEVEGNICKRNRMYGIGIKGGKASCFENRCDENTYAGITVEGEGTSATLSGNVCRLNGSYGISFGEAATGIAQGNRCEHNTVGIGVLGKKTSPKIRRNILQDNDKYGIGIAAFALPEIGDNTILGNKLLPIYREDTTRR
jgi:parallel beta-helix repeat protein